MMHLLSPRVVLKQAGLVLYDREMDSKRSVMMTFLPCVYGYATTIRRAQGASLDQGCLYFDQTGCKKKHPGRGYGYVGRRQSISLTRRLLSALGWSNLHCYLQYIRAPTSNRIVICNRLRAVGPICIVIYNTFALRRQIVLLFTIDCALLGQSVLLFTIHSRSDVKLYP